MRHHLLSPSSLPRSLKCAGSLFGPPTPYEESPASREGTSCHDLLEICIQDSINPIDMIGMVVKDAEYPVTVDMASAVELFIETMYALCDEHGISRHRVRSEVHLSHPQIPNDMFGGTTDVQIPGDDVLITMDLKYGFRQVFADSEQLTAYSLLSMATLGRPFQKVVQVIVQPRAETKVSRHEPGAEELNRVWEQIYTLANYVIANQEMLPIGPPEGSLLAGPHCKYCKRREGCPARAEMMGSLVELSTFENPNDMGTFLSISPTSIPTEQLLFWQERADAINEFMKDVKLKLLQRAEAGEDIPGRKLIATYGNRAWKDADDVMKKRLPRAKLGLAAKQITEQKLLGPAKIEKILKAAGNFKEVKEIFDELVVSHPTGVKLVDVRQKGEAIRPETAVELISRMKNEEPNE